jgi:hypothetical protein
MASHLSIFFTSAMAILVAMSVGVIAVKEFKVGGEVGWMVPDATNTAMYSQWAERHRFHIGDSLSEFAILTIEFLSFFLFVFVFRSLLLEKYRVYDDN